MTRRLGWWCEIAGHADTLDHLAQVFRTGDRRVTKSDGSFHLSLRDLAEDRDTLYVMNEAEATLREMLGLLNVLCNVRGEVGTKSTTFTLPDGSTKGMHSLLEIKAVIFSEPSLRALSSETSNDSTVAADILDSSDEEFRRILSSVRGNDMTWDDLYRLFEWVRKRVGGSKRLKEENRTGKKEISRFTQTANYHRHSRSGKHKLPKAPMTIDEARRYIGSLIWSVLGRLHERRSP